MAAMSESKSEEPESSPTKCNFSVYSQTPEPLKWFTFPLMVHPLRPVNTRELDPETRSRNTFPGKYPNQYTRWTWQGSWMMKQPDWGLQWVVDEKISQLIGHVISQQANFSTYQGACSWNRLVQQIKFWSWLPHIKPVWNEGAKLGSKRFVVQHTFSLEIIGADEGALLRECVAGVCCGSKLGPRVYQPLSYTGCNSL